MYNVLKKYLNSKEFNMLIPVMDLKNKHYDRLIDLSNIKTICFDVNKSDSIEIYKKEGFNFYKCNIVFTSFDEEIYVNTTELYIRNDLDIKKSYIESELYSSMEFILNLNDKLNNKTRNNSICNFTNVLKDAVESKFNNLC